jgi:Xaa-Pro aminopeptidase/Xaa-Pro dipeptidase
MDRMVKSKRERLLKKAEEKGFDAICAWAPENVYYTTEFWGSAISIIENDKTTLLTYNLEKDRAEASSKHCEVIAVERGLRIVKLLCSKLKGKKVIFDEVPNFARNYLNQRLKYIIDEDVFYSIRKVKDRFEIAKIKEAARVINELYKIATEICKVGIKERDIYAEIAKETIRKGCGLTFTRTSLHPFVIASGSNSSYPHAEVSNRELKKGDALVLDIFIRKDGYVCDCTRTFFIGKITKEQRDAYKTVLKAQEEGLKNLAKGEKAGNLDFFARRVIDESKFKGLFVHGLGHGVGLEVHEPPWIRKDSKDVLENNMVVTIEPGIYLKQKFGVRIEDTVIVKERAEVITNFTKDIIILD